MNENVKNFVQSVEKQDYTAAKDQFQTVMADKINSAFENKKIEIAAQMSSTSGDAEETENINEAKVTVADTEVGKFISKNVDKTTKRGGNVNLSIMRQNTIIAHTTDSEGNKHVLNVRTKPDGKFTVGGGMPSMGKPADILGRGKTFSQDKVIEALKAMFELD